MTETSKDHIGWAMTLAAIKDPQGVAEAHGLITGLIAGQPSIEADALHVHWMALHLDQDSIEDQLGQSETEDANKTAMDAALASVKEALASPDMDFQVLVPGVNQPLAQRTESLAQWCSGFLAGFGVVAHQGQGPKAGDESSVDGDEVQEALAMLAEISRATPGIDDGPDEQMREEEEKAFSEVVEFVKVAPQSSH